VKPLKTAIAGWEPVASVCTDPLLQLRSAWREIVGDDVAANSQPEKFIRGALLIVTRSNAWSQQLAFLNERILQAAYERTGLTLERLRFRVGALSNGAAPAARPRRLRTAKRSEQRETAPTLEVAIERFRADVVALGRARAAAGWNECGKCGVRISPASGRFCVPCANARAQERDAAVARLLFEVPWLGYAGIAPLVTGLTPREYEAIRLRLLRRWHDALERLRRSGGKNVTVRERMIASSYVLLKSELDPERIAPAVVRDLLGDELHNIFYGNEK
jgi:hypothetical protein